MKIQFLAVALLALGTALASAVEPPLVSSFAGNVAIPDNNASGTAFAFNLSKPNPAVISGLTIDLNIAGGWNGDLYAYLSHGSSFTVLLNRIGRTTANPAGSGSSGMTVQFSDSYLTDIHNFAGGSLTGNFAADGRNVNPLSVLDTSPRTAPLGNFLGADPNGLWTLFIADLAPAGNSAVQSWTVTVTTAVPEPNSVSLLLLGVLGLARRAVKARRD